MKINRQRKSLSTRVWEDSTEILLRLLYLIPPPYEESNWTCPTYNIVSIIKDIFQKEKVQDMG